MTLLQDRDSYRADAALVSPAGRLVAPRPDGAVRVGGELRAARERLGWTIPQLSAGLRIRDAYLEAIEQGRASDLPALAYAVGFVRSYAATLGLDPDTMAQSYRAEIPAETAPVLDFPVARERRPVPPTAVVLMGALLAVGAYVGWYSLSDPQADRLNAVPAVPARLAAVIAPSPQVASVLPDTVEPAQASSSTASVADQPAEPAVIATAEQPPTTPIASAALIAHTMVVRASADSWVQVRDRDAGSVLLNRVLHANESWPVPPGLPLTMTTGNAAGTELVIDGVASPIPGGAGAVRRDISLDPDAVRGMLAASTPPISTPRGLPQ